MQAWLKMCIILLIKDDADDVTYMSFMHNRLLLSIYSSIQENSSYIYIYIPKVFPNNYIKKIMQLDL